MTFGESIQTCFSKFVTFSGRASRSEYWWFFLFNFLVAVILAIISPKLVALYNLIVLLPGLAVAIRRLHDTDRSGWWLLIGLIPLIGAIILLVFAVQDSKEPNRFG